MSTASDVINECYDKAALLRQEDKYLEALAVESVGNLVNNIHHGRYTQDWLPNAIRIAKATLAESNGLDSDEEKAAYQEGIDILEAKLDSLQS